MLPKEKHYISKSWWHQDHRQKFPMSRHLEIQFSHHLLVTPASPPAMAGQIPDPRSLNSWEDAFQHPPPVARKLEQQLRKSIDENRQKLRSLVGTSYRDLLGTAERIIEMDQQMEAVETH